MFNYTNKINIKRKICNIIMQLIYKNINLHCNLHLYKIFKIFNVKNIYLHKNWQIVII